MIVLSGALAHALYRSAYLHSEGLATLFAEIFSQSVCNAGGEKLSRRPIGGKAFRQSRLLV